MVENKTGSMPRAFDGCSASYASATACDSVRGDHLAQSKLVSSMRLSLQTHAMTLLESSRVVIFWSDEAADCCVVVVQSRMTCVMQKRSRMYTCIRVTAICYRPCDCLTMEYGKRSSALD